MANEQEYITISKIELVKEITSHKLDGWSLSQISATFKDGYDLLYTLERGYDMKNLRIELVEGEGVDSVSAVFPYAYLYENEMKDLFGVKVRGMNVDFNGNLYQMSVKTPYHITTSEGEVEING